MNKRLLRSFRNTAKDAYYALRALRHKGQQVHCPCCDGHFSAFLPFAAGQRQCPRCSSLERHRVIWLYLREKTNLFTDNLKVLHFAPEYVFQKKLGSLPNLDYLSADLNPDVAMIRLDITQIQFPDDSFDVILCNHVLEHIPDDHKAMTELLRVLNPGGWAILQVPVFADREKTFEDLSVTLPEERERLFGQNDHVRVYGLDYEQRLKKAGFVVKVDPFVRRLDKAQIERQGLSPTEDIYFCTKPASD